MIRSTSTARTGISQTAFIVASVVLLAAAVTLNTATSKLRLHFKKDPVPQPRDFHDIAKVMGGWLQVSEDEKLDKEMQDVLGTDKYVYRDYVQVDKYGAELLTILTQGDKVEEKAAAQIRNDFNAKTFDQRVAMIEDALKGKSTLQRKEAVYRLQQSQPDSVVNVGLTYYTGLVDTVAHIPDRCYIADGMDVTNYDVPTWNLGSDAAGKDRPLEVHFINFEDQTGSHRVPKCVAYVFNVNGHYDCDPLGVRRSLQSLTQRYGYYAKIELMTIADKEHKDVAAAGMTAFLSSYKSEIETCFPDWQKLTQTSK
jgi:hypothetical protein